MMTLTPAYGRDYKNKRDVLTDYNAGKDFVIQHIMSPFGGKYANKQDLATHGEPVKIRYGSLMKLIVIDPATGKVK